MIGATLTARLFSVLNSYSKTECHMFDLQPCLTISKIPRLEHNRQISLNMWFLITTAHFFAIKTYFIFVAE